MTENVNNVPYFIQINEPVQTVDLTRSTSMESTHPSLALNSLGNNNVFLQFPENAAEPHSEIYASQDFQIVNEEPPCIYQIVYPHDLNLKPAVRTLKRGRPKKKKHEETKCEVIMQPKEAPQETVIKPPKSARTRSGRLVQVPKHMEKDFKKIEMTTDEQEIQLSDFKRFEEKENTKSEFLELHSKKRQISPQYKCPKCLKAYLGKSRMIQHLKKYPDHGPIPEDHKEFNFDVWNYLFDITQKCKPGQRGTKFCEELSNLLHNLQLLKSALFKNVVDSKNSVHIDKVLGNAIGLTPGKYKFHENELYKDVTVLKLITNDDFFKPNMNKNVNETSSSSDEILDQNNCTGNEQLEDNNKANSISKQLENLLPNEAITIVKSDENLYSSTLNNGDNKSSVTTTGSFSKKINDSHPISLHSDLLSENLLLNATPRTSVDELMLSAVDNGSSLLDNSTSSDEIMNVDQFVNERFKKIIEPDMELGNPSLNLDLPSLELFQFHTR